MPGTSSTTSFQHGPPVAQAGTRVVPAVPESLHRKLKNRAADSGQTLSDYLLAELERLAARPTREEMLVRLHGRKRVILKTPAAVVIREERESA